MSARILFSMLAATLSLVSDVSAQSVERDAVFDAVARSITGYTRFTVFDDVSVQNDDGMITLRGKVTMPFKRDDIGRRVETIEGVRAVRNEITVLPVSIHDDLLRRRVARAIYGNPAFWRYAAMPNPPIHIIVEHGRVTLTGVVPSEVDRALARSLATGLGEFSVVNALRTDADSIGHAGR